MRVRRLAVALVGAPLLVTVGLMACVLPARAAGAPDISGTWRCCGAGGAAHQRWVITDSGGKLSGHGGGPVITYPIRGRVAGSRARIVTGPYKQLPSYTATFRGVVSPDDTTIKGTWTSNAGQSGTFTAVRIRPAAGSAASSPSTIMSLLAALPAAFGGAGALIASAVVAVVALLFRAFPSALFNLTLEADNRDISAWGMRRRFHATG
jgi:hypothetical protein